MATQPRTTGVGLVGNLPWGSHFCYFYGQPADLFGVNLSYFATGLENRELCTWVHPDSDFRGVDQLMDALGKMVPDLETRLALGEMEIVSHEEWFLRGASIDLEQPLRRLRERVIDARARGYAGLRVSGSGGWLHEQMPGAFQEFEQMLERFCPRQPVLVMCTFPLPSSDPRMLIDSVRTHQFALLDTAGKAAERAPLERAVEQSRELVESLVNSIEGILVEVDAQTFTATFVSQAFERILGYPRARWLRDPNFWRDHIHPEDRDWALKAKMDAAARREDLKNEYRMIAADGRTVWLRDVITIRSRDDLVVMRGVMVDVTDRKTVEDELRVANERLRTISNRIELAREEEGARIARELHDELGSALTSLNWELEDLDRLVAGVGEQRGLQLHERVATMAKQVASMIAAVRRVAAELRPSILDDLGLVAALSYQAQQFEHRYRIVCRFEASVDDLDISPAAAAAVFRIVQEALTNVARHASATDVRITAEEDEDGAVVEVRDNGRGISESEAAGSRTCGLLGMRERAELVGGRITIGGTPGRGTVVQVRVPYIRRARE